MSLGSTQRPNQRRFAGIYLAPVTKAEFRHNLRGPEIGTLTASLNGKGPRRCATSVSIATGSQAVRELIGWRAESNKGHCANSWDEV